MLLDIGANDDKPYYIYVYIGIKHGMYHSFFSNISFTLWQLNIAVEHGPFSSLISQFVNGWLLQELNLYFHFIICPKTIEA